MYEVINEIGLKHLLFKSSGCGISKARKGKLQDGFGESLIKPFMMVFMMGSNVDCITNKSVNGLRISLWRKCDFSEFFLLEQCT